MSERRIVIAGAVALAISLLGALFAWPAFLRSWLTATLTIGAIPLGAVAVLMTHGLTGGAWGERSRWVWQALAATMPLFVVAMLPLLFGLDTLFSWTRPEEQLPEVVRNKLLYLNEPFFVVRSLFYFAVWLGLAWLLGAWSGRVRSVHAPGLILWVLTITFFGFDWLMSLEPKFYSDVYGLMLVTGIAGAGLAAGLLLAVNGLEPTVRQDLANIWLAVLLGWAFMSFAQLIIIWSGNLPDEIEWYLHRHAFPWRIVCWTAFVLFFLGPFVILLSSAAKRRRGWLSVAAVLCLAGYLLYVQWLVMPAFEDWHLAQYLLDPAALVAIGAAFVWLMRRRLQRLETRAC